MKRIALLLLCSLLYINVFAQNELLQTKVSLHHKEITIQDALKVLQLKYGIHFSYSSNIIPTNKKIQLYLKQVPLEVALKTIFLDTEVGYEVVGTQIVLRRVVMPKPQGRLSTRSKPTATIKIPDPTPEVVKTTIPPDSNKVDTSLQVVSLPEPSLVASASKQDSTTEAKLDSLYIEEKTKMKSKMSLLRDSLKSKSKATLRQLDLLFSDIEEEMRQDYFKLRDSIRRKDNEFLPVPNKSTFKQHQQQDSVNHEYVHRKAQASFIYPIGSNGIESPYFINTVSLNLLAGVNGGVEGAEVGGFANVVKGKVQGLHAAGFINVVGGDVTGLQAAGFANVNGAKVSGIQAAGFMNVIQESSNGIQVAGFMNVNGTHAKGIQGAGFLNLNGGKMIGTQAAGFMNLTARDVTGIQAAGFANFCGGTMTGIQASGFMNVTKKLAGTQIGVFNFADTISKGIPIGIFSFVRHGKHNLEIFGSETFQANAVFKTGVKCFYNILYAGYQFRPNSFRWSYGYGIGTEITMGKKWYMNFDGLAMHVNENEEHTNTLNLNTRIQTSIGYKLSNGVALFVGPNINLLISDYKNADGSASTLPRWKLGKTGPYNDQFYWGITAGMRFF